MRFLTLLTAVFTTTIAAMVFTAPIAKADEQFRVGYTSIGIYPRANPSMEAKKVGKLLKNGALITVVCKVEGQSISNSRGENKNWNRLSDGSYLPHAFILSEYDGWSPSLPQCLDLDSPDFDSHSYTENKTNSKIDDSSLRNTAVNWMKENEDHIPCPIDPKFDSTWTVLQALTKANLAGANFLFSKELLQNSTSCRSWSKNRKTPDQLYKLIIEKGSGVEYSLDFENSNAPGSSLGDLVFYKYFDDDDNYFDEVAMVTDYTREGDPIVSGYGVHRIWSWSRADQSIKDIYPEAKAVLVKFNY